MGYRSDVAIRIETVNGLNVESVLNELREKLEKSNFDLISDDDITISPNKDILTLSFSDVKWYDSYGDVEIVMSWFEHMEELANDWMDGIGDDDVPTVSAAQYICIGEDLEDIEERYSGDMNDPMYINRSIEF